MVIYNRSHISLSSLILLHLSGAPATTAALIFLYLHVSLDVAWKSTVPVESSHSMAASTEHPDYLALTNTTVLRQVSPLIRDKNGRTYRCRNGTSENE